MFFFLYCLLCCFTYFFFESIPFRHHIYKNKLSLNLNADSALNLNFIFVFCAVCVGLSARLFPCVFASIIIGH
jgi:hypothetical protein